MKAQPYVLKAVNKGSGKVMFIKEGTRVNIEKSDGTIIKGKYYILNDSMFFVKNDTICIKDAMSYKKYSKKLKLKIINKIVAYTFAGTLGTYLCYHFIDETNNNPDLHDILIVWPAVLVSNLIIGLANNTTDTKFWNISIDNKPADPVKVKYKYSWF